VARFAFVLRGRRLSTTGEETMVVPLAARWVAAACGLLLVLTVWQSVIGTLVVPRLVGNWLTRLVDRVVIGAYALATKHVIEYRRRDRILATEAAGILVIQLATWLGISFTGFTLLLWPFAGSGVTEAFKNAGSSEFTLGTAPSIGGAPPELVFMAAFTGLVVVTLQIAYLPTLYSAFNRRETEVALLNARAGVPSWGPELLARTHYALGSGVSTLDTLPDLYDQWERWAADVAESHTTYLPLVRFRSPRPMSSWVTSLLAVLDSAALMLSLAPDQAPTVSARLCLRGGRDCLTRVAQALGVELPEEADPAEAISLSYEEFLDGVRWMEKVGFPFSQQPAEAWPDFIGWRVNYERAAYAIAERVDAVPALWSGSRRHPTAPIPPFRPPTGHPPSGPADTDRAQPGDPSTGSPAH
jgi:hypothetical protein